MHRQLIEEFGGSQGLRDAAWLELPIFARRSGTTTVWPKKLRL